MSFISQKGARIASQYAAQERYWRDHGKKD